VIDVTGSDNGDVGADVVVSVVVDEVLSFDVSDVVSDTEDGLTEVVVSVRCVVTSFKGCFKLVFVCVDAISPNGFSFGFDLVLVVERVGQDVTEEVNSFSDATFGDSEGVSGCFSFSFGFKMATESSNIIFDLLSGSVLGSSEVEMFKIMRNRRGIKSFLSRTALNSDLDGGEFSRPGFRDDLNTIGKGG